MKPKSQLFLFCLLSTMLTFSFAQTKLEPATHLNIDEESHIAVSGYDLISYFEGSTPVKGSPKWTATHAGAHYHFSTANHRNEFLKNPDKYLPIYGGWCAYAIGKYGQKVSIDPETNPKLLRQRTLSKPVFGKCSVPEFPDAKAHPHLVGT